LAASTDARWQPLASTLLSTREFGDELLVWNDASGSTHLLDSMPRAVFCALCNAGTALSADDLARTLDDDGTQLHDVLAELLRIGLVQKSAT
jgi:PqqD family protein of HPr-rel-A system